ncbi:hypothetical protein [Sphingobacterium sp. SYP-B4668]|uniref:hypothetical protein n=1 Tax=Sphingobacterium sp. SYP-B4668 TaxID=2996035 RepID=UPI0005325392|nr:hypothetical protein [Sphingobacterium sp. SYP-B4668]
MRFKKIQRADSSADIRQSSGGSERNDWSQLKDLVGINSKIKLRSLQGNTILHFQITLEDFDNSLYRSLIGAYEGDIIQLENHDSVQDFLLIEVD